MIEAVHCALQGLFKLCQFVGDLPRGNTEISTDPDIDVRDTCFTSKLADEILIGYLKPTHDTRMPTSYILNGGCGAAASMLLDRIQDLHEIVSELRAVLVPISHATTDGSPFEQNRRLVSARFRSDLSG